jgi:hypothetical protein
MGAARLNIEHYRRLVGGEGDPDKPGMNAKLAEEEAGNAV